MNNQALSGNPDVYFQKSDGVIFSPFSLSVDAMEKLILINFEKDPDEFYNVFELQQACDKNGVWAYLVIAYRKDGAADVYHQTNFPFGSQSSLLNDVSFFVRPLEDTKFEVSDGHMEVNFAFEDETQREIKVKVKETNLLKKKPFYLLAPIGVLPRNPKSLPVYSLFEMAFTQQEYTTIEIEIGRVKHKPDTFPLPIDYARNYFTRYSQDTFNVDLNRNFHGTLLPLKPGRNNCIESDETYYELIDNEGHLEIKSMSAKNAKHHLKIDFSPPVPDLVCLKDGIKGDGNFMITVDKSTGVIGGGYHLHRSQNEIEIQLRPHKGWQPHEGRWILKILFLVVKVFKEWPKSYVWTAKIRMDKTDQPIMESSWKRKSENAV